MKFLVDLDNLRGGGGGRHEHCEIGINGYCESYRRSVTSLMMGADYCNACAIATVNWSTSFFHKPLRLF